MGKLAARDSEVNRPFKTQIYQKKRTGQGRNFYDSHNYNKGYYQNRYRSNSRDRESQFSRQNRSRPRYKQNYKRENCRDNARSYQNLEDRVVEENTEIIIGMKITAKREIEVGLGKGHFQGIVITEGMTEAQVIVDQDLDQEQVQIGTELDVTSAESMTTKKEK